MSDHWPPECLFNSLFGLRPNKHQISTLLSLCEWNVQWWLVDSPHKGPIMRNFFHFMGLLPDTQNCKLRMRRECSFPCHRLQRKPLVSNPGMHHGTCVTYVPWCMSGSLTSGGGENVPCIPGACATRNFAYLARGPLPYTCWPSSPGIQCMSVSVPEGLTC